ncbi:MAG: hypothetical protein HPY45_07540 [Anaerolineae bacterium]|nr:hypothetical protein [Anaerolineae bacterium]
MKNRHKINWMLVIEAICLGGIFVLAWRFFFRHSGGPMSWDEVQYMAVSLNPQPHAHILNRYFHIYFQKLFFVLAGSPLAGARLFWSFLIASSMLLIYINARLLSRSHNAPLYGIVSVLLFFTYPPLIKESGVTYADVTVMMLLTLALYIYLMYHHTRAKHAWLLILLGIIWFFAIKSKESGIAFASVLLGLAFSNDGKLNLRGWIRCMGFVMIGLLIGQVFLMLLDWAFLGDALFSLRLENFKVLREFNFVGEHTRSSENWFENIFSLLSVPFWLMIIGFLSKSSQLKPHEKVLWLLPFGLIVFLNISMINGKWGAITRYYWPAVSTVAILGSQCMPVDDNVFRNSWQTIKRFVFDLAKRLRLLPQSEMLATHRPLTPALSVLLIALTLLVLAALALLAYGVLLFSRAYDWYLGDFLGAIVYPFALTTLILLFMFFKRWNATLLAAALVCFALLPICSGYGNIRDFVKDKIIAYRNTRFMPYIVYEDRVSCLSEGERIYFSESLYTNGRGYLGSDALNSSWMFNLYFSCNIQPSQVMVSAVTHDLIPYRFTYGFILEEDFRRLDENARIEIERHYRLYRSPGFDVILLSAH